MELVKIGSVTPNPKNPRFIKNEKYKLLIDSIKQSPSFMILNPIVVDLDNIILGGNMRHKACLDLKHKKIPRKIFTREHAEINNKARRKEGIKEATYEEQCLEFIIKDNISFGDNDWDVLANEWDYLPLQSWGLEGFPFEEVDLDSEELVIDETHKTIPIPFKIKDYEEANELVQLCKEKAFCVGTIVMEGLRKYSKK